MRIIINRGTLAQALGEVSPFINPKVVIPILKGIKVTTKGKRIKFEASDTQAVIRKYAVAEEIDCDGEFIVEADFDKYIQKVKGDTVTLEYTDGTLTVIHSKGRAEFSTMPATEFPKFDMPSEDVTEIKLPAALLADCVSSARGFVGTDDLRPQMKPIYAYVRGGEFGYCATDTRVMITEHNPVEASDATDIHWYIEPSVFSAIVRGCKGGEEVTVRIAPAAVSYRLGNTIIQTVQTKGKFPDFNRVIPPNWAIECHVDRRDLTETLNRVAMCADFSRLVKLAITPMDMAVSSDNIETQRRSSETLQHNGCNGEITIGFQSDYLLLSLGAYRSDEVCFRLTDASRPMLIHSAERPNMTILQMPMNIANR